RRRTYVGRQNLRDPIVANTLLKIAAVCENVGRLRGKCIRQSILESEIRAQSTRCLEVELKHLQPQACSGERERSKGHTAEAGADRCAAANSSCSASAIRVGPAAEGCAVGTISLIVEVVNEGIVFAYVRAITLVFKRVVEEPLSAAHHKFR